MYILHLQKESVMVPMKIVKKYDEESFTILL